MRHIIYKITCLKNKKIYIGQTSQNLNKRWDKHWGIHLHDGTKLHNDMIKFGMKNFTIAIMDIVDTQEEANNTEAYWINFFDTINSGYNTTIPGHKCGGDTLTNNPNIVEIKKKISNALKGSKNGQSKKVKAINIITGEEKIYESFSECQEDLNIERHDIIGRRCRKEILKPYDDKWLFEYV